MTARTYEMFFDEVLHLIGVTPTTANRRALAVVSIIEGVNSYWNPLNSVIPFGHSKPYNSVGVQMYQSFDDGVKGTAALLKQPRWAGVVKSMKTAKTRIPILVQFLKVYSSWGSHPAMMLFSWRQAQTRLNRIMLGK